VPALVAPIVGFALGAALSYGAADSLARGRGSGIASRALIVVTAFSVLIYAPVCSYFLAFSPDWSFAYLVDSRRLPSAVDLTLVLLDVVSVPFGFATTLRKARARHLRWVFRAAVLPAAGSLFAVLVLLPRLGVQATYAQYHGDFGMRPTAGSELGYALLWMHAVLIGALLWTARALKRLTEAGAGQR
jgi:hypothetical protein